MHPNTSITQEEIRINADCESMLTPAEAQMVETLLQTAQYGKGANILRAGEVAIRCCFIHKGCVRQYYLVDGEERTTAFFTEGETLSSMLSFVRREPSRHYLQCVEDSVILFVTWEAEKKLFAAFPRLESLSRVSTTEQFGEYQENMATFLFSTPEERYLHLVNTRPELLQRIPLYQLASYLGVKPESLSRIRRRLLLKEKVAV